MAFLRALGLLIAMLAMVGCGACGMFGFYLASRAHLNRELTEFLIYGVIGVTFAAMFGWGIYRRMRYGGASRSSAPPRQ